MNDKFRAFASNKFFIAKSPTNHNHVHFGVFGCFKIYIGITYTRGMLAATFWAAMVFFAVYLTLFPLYANHALWLALLLYLVTRGVVQTLLFRRRRDQF